MFYLITYVNATNNELGVSGDFTSYFVNGVEFVVSESTAKDGLYTTISSTFDGANTIISVNENIGTSVVDGKITAGLYTINFTDPAKPTFNILPHEINGPGETNSDTSLIIPGRGSLNYGEKIIENLVHIMENFAGPTPPPNSTVGQQWFDTTTGTMKRSTLSGWTATVDMADDDLLFNDPEHPTGSDIIVTGSGAFADVGLQVRIETDPASGDSIFRVLSEGGTERLRVEHDGLVSTQNSLSILGTTLDNYFAHDIQFANTKGIKSVLGAELRTNATGNGWELKGVGTNSPLIIRDNLDNDVFNVDGTFDVNVQNNLNVSDSATITNDLIVDTDTLVVDSTNNRVGVNVLTPTAEFQVGTDTLVADDTNGRVGINVLNPTAEFQVGTHTFIATDGLITASNRIANVTNPTNPQDVATKDYVDTLTSAQDQLSELDDVTITSPLNGEALIYTAGEWVNGSVGGFAGFAEDSQDAVAQAFAAGTQNGMTFTYNDLANSYDIDFNDPTITLTGAVTGAVTMNDLGNVTIITSVNHTHPKSEISDFVESAYVHTTGTEVIAGDKTFSNNLIVSGDLTVNGTTTQVNTNQLNIGDNILVLNHDEAGTPSQNAGLEIERGTSTNARLLFIEGDDTWKVDPGTGTLTALSLVGHNHDSVYYTETEVNNLLANKSDTTHNHNSVYYTETEVNNLLANKSDTTHNHDASYVPKVSVTNSGTTAYTLTLSDAYTYLRRTSASANTVTVPTNASAAFAIGTQIDIRQHGAGTTSLVAAGGVTLNRKNTLDFAEQHGVVSIIKVGTDEWDCVGDLT